MPSGRIRMTRDEADANVVLLQKAWEAALAAVGRKGEVKGDRVKMQKSFVRRKACAGVDSERCIAALNHALCVAQELRRHQFSNMGTRIPSPVKKYEQLFVLAKRLRDALPDAPDLLIDLACRTIQGEWLR